MPRLLPVRRTVRSAIPVECFEDSGSLLACRTIQPRTYCGLGPHQFVVVLRQVLALCPSEGPLPPPLPRPLRLEYIGPVGSARCSNLRRCGTERLPVSFWRDHGARKRILGASDRERADSSSEDSQRYDLAGRPRTGVVACSIVPSTKEEHDLDSHH